MLFFKNDYNDIAEKGIMEALQNAMDEKNVGYGFDKHSEDGRNAIKKLLKSDDIDIHFIPGGTSANILGATQGLRSQDSILAATTGHINVHEAGAIEATGHRIETIMTKDGKLSPSLIEEKLSGFNNEYVTKPRLIYISNTTELGGVYKKKELEDLYAYAKKNDLYLYIDGARMAHALASDFCDYTYEDLVDFADIFTLGGTKNGLMFGEAMVIVNRDLKENFMNLIKQKGAMIAKGFILGIQYEYMINSGKYEENAKKAYAAAEKLYKIFEAKGYKFYQEFESNQLFVLVEKSKYEELNTKVEAEKSGEVDGKVIMRFVTTYRTTNAEIAELENLL